MHHHMLFLPFTNEAIQNARVVGNKKVRVRAKED